MANGKKNYFRHSFFAFEDEKIQMAIEKLGYEGYAYYFILLELLAKSCENEFKNPITIHKQSLKIVWRKQSKSINKVITKLQESGLFVATFKGNFIEFDIPKLKKYLGKYEIKNQSNSPNKKKRKEIKEKEIKVPYNPLEKAAYKISDLIQKWNDELGDDFGYCQMIPSRKMLDDFFTTAENLKAISDWDFVFEKCREINWANGNNKSGWYVNLPWLLDFNNLTKLVNAKTGESSNKSIKNFLKENPYAEN